MIRENFEVPVENNDGVKEITVEMKDGTVRRFHSKAELMEAMKEEREQEAR